MTIKSIIANIQAVALLLLSLYLMFLFLASGHGVNFEDVAQVKLLLEILIFFITGIALFFSKRNFLVGNVTSIVLLILVQLAFIDFYIEISDVEYGNEKPIIILILLFLFFVINLFLIYSQIKAIIRPHSKQLK